MYIMYSIIQLSIDNATRYIGKHIQFYFKIISKIKIKKLTCEE